jgi:AmiR/NasT family two-component response regulator
MFLYVSLKMGLGKATTQPIIWIIDREQWPRAYLRAELIERGFDAIGFIEVSQAIAAINDPDYLKPQLIILELHDFSFTQDEWDTLARTSIPMIALGGAVELNQEWVRNFQWMAVIQRPFSIGKVADVAEGLLGIREGEPC